MHHTHWDREWYRSFADFRFRLLRAAEHIVSLLEDDALPVFLFDGQTSVIDDIDDAAGENLKERLHELIRQGRIEVGPWYIMPDEFLVSGEAILRNLEIGMAESRKLGSSPDVLYLPDTFGHISQLPAIARMFRLKSILVARGVNQSVSDLLWKGADGCSIHTHALPLWSGYYQDFLHADTYVDLTDTFISQSDEYACGAPVLLTAGSDHCMPPGDWKERASSLSSHLSGKSPSWEMSETGLSSALKEIRDFYSQDGSSHTSEYPGSLEGELRDNGKAYILSGVLSSRVDLKLANVEAQDILSYALEPLGYFASPQMLYPEHRNLLWKLLIQNHAHDSIGGCSIDEVHGENHVRFQQVRSGASRQIQDITRRLAGRKPGVFNDQLLLWNQLPYTRETPVRVEVFIPQQEDRGSFILMDGNEQFELDILTREPSEGFFSEFEYPVNWYPGWKYSVEFVPRLKGMGRKTYRIVPCGPETHVRDRIPAQPRNTGNSRGISVLENADLRVEIQADGSINLINTTTAVRIENALLLLWEHDDGDSYTSSPRPTGACWGKPLRIEHVVRNRFSSHCKVTYLGPDESEADLLFRLRDGEQFVRLNIVLNNRSRNSRIRLIAGQEGPSRSSVSDTAFDLVKREHHHIRPHTHTPQREAYPNEWPSSSFLAAADVSICHNGFHGYDLLPDGRIALNLLRAVGTLSRAELPERGGGAGPHLDTPEAQMQKRVEGEIGIYPGSWDSPVLTSLMFRVSPLWDQGQSPGEPAETLELNNRQLVLSALYRIHSGLCFLRIWNSSSKDQQFSPRLPKGSRLKRLPGAMPLEESISLEEFLPRQFQSLDDVDLPLAIGPKEIAAFLIYRKEAAE